MIKVNQVSMRFRIANDKIQSLKEYMIAIAKKQLKYKDFWVFQDINFEVKKGEVVGIIGRNGSGKSTLLKIISGVLTPTKGKVILEGNVVPMLELGSGFDIELSGRENIFLNGSILGYKEEFLKEKYEEILEFSELGEFIEMPIRNYSSGMLMRLAFSIATIVQPEILIVDEILAVGDEAFQRKSKRKMLELMSGGTTVLFVSHSIDQIREMCNRVVWIENGKINMIGEAKSVCDAYQEFMNPAVNIEKEMIEKRQNIEANKYYMDVLFIYGDIGADYEWRVHNQREQLLAGNMCSSEIYYKEINEELIKKYRVFIFIQCLDSLKIRAFIEKIKAFNKVVLLEPKPELKHNKEEIWKEIDKRWIDGVIVSNQILEDELKKMGYKTYLNLEVCSDHIEQLSQWAVYDRDVLPLKDAKEISGDMELINYYKALQSYEERKKDKERIGYFGNKIEKIEDVLYSFLKQNPRTILYLKSEPEVLQKEDWKEMKEQNRIRISSCSKTEVAARRYAEVDFLIFDMEEAAHWHLLRREEIQAGLVKVPFLIYTNGIRVSKDQRDFKAIICETEKELYENMKKMCMHNIRKEYAEKLYEYFRKEGVAVYTGNALEAYISSLKKEHITFVIPDQQKEEDRNQILQYANLYKEKGYDVLILKESGKGENILWNKKIFSVLSREETYIYGSFDKVIVTSWSAYEFLQSYANIKERFYLVQEFLPEKYDAGDFQRFRINQTYNPCIALKFLTTSLECKEWLEKNYRQSVIYLTNDTLL